MPRILPERLFSWALGEENALDPCRINLFQRNRRMLGRRTSDEVPKAKTACPPEAMPWEQKEVTQETSGEGGPSLATGGKRTRPWGIWTLEKGQEE